MNRAAQPLHGGGNTKPRPASKIPVPSRTQKPSIGVASSETGKSQRPPKQTSTRTESKKPDIKRSQLEQSLNDFIIARKELQEIVSAEGSNEQHHGVVGSDDELKAELQRHKELTSALEAAKGREDDRHPSRGLSRKGSSYEFLKSILD